MNCLDEPVCFLKPHWKRYGKNLFELVRRIMTQTHHTTNFTPYGGYSKWSLQKMMVLRIFLRPGNNLRADFCCTVIF